MKIRLRTITHLEGNKHIPGHRYKSYYDLEIGFNRIKLNATEYNPKFGHSTWYPISIFWWPPNSQWFRKRLLGIHIRKRPTPGVIG